MNHPLWPDGTLVEIGHHCTVNDKTGVWRIAGITSTTAGARFSVTRSDDYAALGFVAIERLRRVQSPRPVSGEMPERLAQWLENYDGPADYGFDEETRQRRDEVIAWARTLLIMDAEIVEDDKPDDLVEVDADGNPYIMVEEESYNGPVSVDRCDATKSDGTIIWFCSREAGHPKQWEKSGETSIMATGYGHFDPKLGWW